MNVKAGKIKVILVLAISFLLGLMAPDTCILDATVRDWIPILTMILVLALWVLGEVKND